MEKNTRSISLYGVVKINSDKKHRFDDSKLFQKNLQFGVLLKSIKIYFGKNIKNLKTLVGLEASYINYINGQKIKGEFYGIEKLTDDVEIKELVMEGNDYIKTFEFNFDELFNYINYIRIITSKGKDIEFGKRGEKIVTILNYNGDNMIQFFWGDYDDEEGINAISFKYISRKQFIFGSRIPILFLRHKILYDEEFKKKYNDNYKELLKDNKSLMYLYRSCLLPDTIFAKILKYC